MQQSVSFVKKLISVNKTNADETVAAAEELDQMQPIKRSGVETRVPRKIVWYIENVKSTVAGILSAPAERKLSDHQRLCEKLCAFVQHIRENALLREYVNHVYSKNQRSKYELTVDEVTQSCEELSSNLKNMFYLNDRNMRVADMIIDITQSSKEFEEKKKRVCIEVEVALQQRMLHKWSVLSNSKDKHQLEKFLNEITGQRNAVKSRQNQAQTILAICQDDRVANAKTDGSAASDADAENDDPDGSFGSTAAASLAGPRSLVSPTATSGLDGGGRDTATAASSGWFPDADLSLMYEQEAATTEADRW